MNEFKPDWDAMAVMVENSQEQAAKIEQLEKQLAVQTYAADNYRRLLDESDHAYLEMELKYESLLKSALYALEYACDMTKPDDMSGCGCPICSSIKEIEECLK